MIFRRVGPSEDAEKYVLVHSGCRWLCVHARKLHVAESFARVTRRQYGKPRDVYIATKRYYMDDPVSFICSLNSCACMGEHLSRVPRIFVCAYATMYLRASYCLLGRGLTSYWRIATFWELFYGLRFQRNCKRSTRNIINA